MPVFVEAKYGAGRACYLCRVHRATLQRFRQQAVTHAEDSAQLWLDDQHSSPVRDGEAEADDDEDGDGSGREPTAESALVSAPTSAPRYSTFEDVGAAAVDDGEEEEFEKRPLSFAARSAVAGGWLLVVSFVALTCAWGIVARLRT